MHRKPRHMLSALLIALMGMLMGFQVQWPDAMISALSWSPDGQYVASGNSEGTFIVQNLSLGESVEFTMGLVDPDLTEILWKNETQLLAVAGSGDAQLWDLPSRALKQKFYTRYGMGNAIWTKDGTHFLSGGEFGVALNLWNAETGEIVSSSEEGGTIGALAWSSDQSRFVSASYGFFSIHDSQTLKAIHKIEISTKPLAILVAAAWQPTGKLIAVGDVYGVVRVYAADTLEPVAEFSVSDQPQIDVRQGWFSKSLITLSFSADVASLFTVTTDGTVQTWRVPDFTRVSNETLGVFVADAAWSPYQGRLAYALRPQVISEGMNVRTADSRNLSEIQILVPSPSLDRLNTIAALCVRDAPTRTRAVTGLTSQHMTSLNALPDFVAQVESLPEGAIPAACRADLLAVADALR